MNNPEQLNNHVEQTPVDISSIYESIFSDSSVFDHWLTFEKKIQDIPSIILEIDLSYMDKS